MVLQVIRQPLGGSKTAAGRLPCWSLLAIADVTRRQHCDIVSAVCPCRQAISGWVIRFGTLNLHKCSQIGSVCMYQNVE